MFTSTSSGNDGWHSTWPNVGNWRWHHISTSISTIQIAATSGDARIFRGSAIAGTPKLEAGWRIVSYWSAVPTLQSTLAWA
jgi:hypothetical protein